MKATGIVRHVDDLGRIVIPKEIRRTMAIQEGNALEIYITDDGILFRKCVQSVENKTVIAQKWLEQNARTMKNLSARFSIGDKITICEVIDDNCRRTGTAIAAAEDSLSPAVGMVIAFCRATGRTIPQELLED